MRWYFLLVLSALFLPPAAVRAAEKQPARDGKGDLYVVAIGQEDGWRFLPQGFERAFREQGKPFYREMHSRVLVGPKATRKQLLADLEWAAGEAKPGDQVMLFIACHGTCTKQGESIFATREGSVRPREVKKILAKAPCHALVVNDACCSGNWVKEFDGDPMPDNVTALCCCQSDQLSGIEFDITLFEALYGKADFDGDGAVDLDEVIRYCGLRIREVQGGKLRPVLHRAKSLKGAAPPRLTKASRELIGVAAQGELFAGLIEGQDGDEYRVRVIGFGGEGGAFPIRTRFRRDEIILPRDGTPLMVEKEGRWRPAFLAGQKKKDGYEVRYLGSSAREVVRLDRVRHVFAGSPGESFTVNMFRKR
jgi:hypothetical protein